MGIKEDIDGRIDAIKAMSDSTFPDLPSTRRKSSQVRAVFDAVTVEMKEINDMAADGLTEIEGDISEIKTSKADKTVTDAMQSTLTALQQAIQNAPTSSAVTTLQQAVDSLTSNLSGKVDKTTTVNSKPLSGNVTLNKSDIGLGGVDNTSDANKPVSSATQTALNAKANQTDLDKKPFVFISGSQANAPKMWLGSAVVSGGNAVFYLTDTGASGGSAIFTNSNVFVQPILYAANAPPAFAPLTLSADRKTLTIPVSKATIGIQLLGINLLGANAPANGDTVQILAIGT